MFEISRGHPRGAARAAFALAERGRAPTAPRCRRAEPTRIVLRPAAVDDGGFTVEPDPEDAGAFVVRGERPGAVDPADRLRQRRGRRLPGRPAGPARRRGRAGQGRRASPVPPVTIGERHLRLGADHWPTRPRSCDGPARHRPAAGARAPGPPRPSGWPRTGPGTRASTPTRPSRWRTDDVAPEALARHRRPGRGGAAPAMSVRDAVRRREPGRRQGRLVVADHRRRRARPGPAGRAGRRARPRRRAAGTQVVLVSSGAIAAGLAPLRLPRRPRDLATQQAAASVGPAAAGRALRRVVRAVPASRSGRCCSPPTTWSAGRTTATPSAPWSGCSSLGVVPVVNENDTVATDEIRFGDNDRLAALVAHLVGADALVLLSDVDGLYDGDPRRPDARLVARGARDADDLAGVGIAGAGQRRRHRRDGDQARRGADRDRGRHPGAARGGRAGAPRCAGRRAGRAPRSARDGPADRVPAVLAAARRRRRAGRSSSTRAPSLRSYAGVRSLLSAGITGVRGDFECRRRGRPARPGRRGRRPRPGRVRRGRAAGAARPVQLASSPRSTGARSCTGTILSSCAVSPRDAVTGRTLRVHSHSVSWCRF